MTEYVEWLRLEGASRDHLAHSHLAQAGHLVPISLCSKDCVQMLFDLQGTQRICLMVEQGARHPEPLNASSTSPSPNTEYRHCPGLHPLLLLHSYSCNILGWFLIAGAALAALMHTSRPHELGRTPPQRLHGHHICCVEHQLRLDQSWLLRQK